MALSSDALVTVAEAKAALRLDPARFREPALAIHIPSGDVQRATVEATAVALVLRSTTNNVLTTTTMTYSNASYDTITEVVAAIRALAANWIVDQYSADAVDTQNMVQMGETDCLGQSVPVLIENYELIELLIDAVSDEICTYTGRKFASQDFTEDVHANEDHEVWLDNYPVTALKGCWSQRTDMIDVKCTASDAAEAFVYVTSTGVNLVQVGGSADGTISKTFVANATMTAMVTALDGETGWDATIASSDYNNLPSSRLYEQQTEDCLDANADLYAWTEATSLRARDVDAGLFAAGAGGRMRVTYTAGYSSIPNDLKGLCLDLLRVTWDKAGIDPSGVDTRAWAPAVRAALWSSDEFKYRLGAWKRGM